MSCSIALRRSPKPGALTLTELNVPRILLTTSVARASPSTSSAMMTSGLPDCMTFSSTGTRSRTAVIFRADEQDVGVVEHGFHALGIGDHVGRDVALVEAHALDQVHLHAEGVRLLDGDDPVLADLVDGLGDHLADLAVGRADAGDLGDLALVLDVHRDALDGLDGSLDGGLDALLQRHRVGAGGHVAQPLAHHRPGEHGGGGGAVARDVVGLLGDLFDQLGPDVLVGVLELDLLGDGDAVVGDGRRSPLLVEHHVAALRAEGDAHGVGELVHPPLERTASLLVELDDLRHLGHSSGVWRELLALSVRDC